jgi:hypothetical protein
MDTDTRDACNEHHPAADPAVVVVRLFHCIINICGFVIARISPAFPYFSHYFSSPSSSRFKDQTVVLLMMTMITQSLQLVVRCQKRMPVPCITIRRKYEEKCD